MTTIREKLNERNSSVFLGRSSRKLVGYVRLCATFLVAFLLSFAVSTMANPVSNSSAVECVDGVTSSGGVCGTDTADVNVSVEGGWAISVSSAGTLGVDVSPTNSGVLSTVVDNVNVYTNIPTGYQLYLNSTSGNTNIYNASDTEQSQNHFTATTGTKDAPVDLTNNTWGYSLDNSPTTFAKVALANDDPDSNIYTANTKTPSEGDDIPVTYGFMADTKLQPGTYSTSVTYTAIADAPAYSIQSISPSALPQDDQTDKQITILTTVPATELAFGDISARIVGATDSTSNTNSISLNSVNSTALLGNTNSNVVELTDCIEITQDVSGTSYRGVTCTYSGSLTPGYYTIELTSSWHNATYAKSNAFAIMSYLTVSGGSGSGWYAPDTVVDITADACASGYTFNNWTTTGGTLTNASVTPTTITTTADNITVTRNCKVAGVCPNLAVNETGTVDGYQVKKLADNKCWITTVNATVRWSQRSCPSAKFTIPTVDDFNTLVRVYNSISGGIYAAWNRPIYPYYWSSTAKGSGAYSLTITSGGSASVGTDKTSSALAVRCYTIQ